MALWFGVSSVAPRIAAEWRLTDTESSWLTLGVQLGFVLGTLVSATLNLPDIMKSRHLMALCAVAGAAVNALLATTTESFGGAVVLRFVTGVLLAGVYPPGMKVIATWFRQGRGLALGALVGALTLGKASPYLVNALGSGQWRLTVLVASLSSVAGAVIVLVAVHDGPYAMPSQPFDLSQVTKVFANRGVRLASFGYFGHMWELYAMWAWAPVMIRSSLAKSGDAPWIAEAASFAVIGAGAAGCVAAGVLADRFGRTLVASAAMLVSGFCCLAVGFAYGRTPILLMAITAIWGATVVADSAQFSACVTELGDPRYLGTALTLQTSIGFLITTISIALVPPLVNAVGWPWVFAALAPGPLLGIVAMMRLRSLPESAAIAQGRR
jgi:MFS family permease